MKRLIYISFAAVLIALAACGGRRGSVADSEEVSAEEVQVYKPDERIAIAQRLFDGYFYDEAIDTLRAALQAARGDDEKAEINALIAEIEDGQAALVKYTGPVHHVFFHSLIIYPELAFKSGQAQGYNMWMTTVSEFEKMLPALHERGYVLYNINDYIEQDSANPARIKLRDIMLPPGKIPLVLSIDDVNYYKYMEGDGFASRLVLGDDGRVYTEVRTPEGDTVTTRTGDVMPILDDYVAAHPDFSFRGAKGIIALTGYEGAMGYRIVPGNSDERNAELTAAAKAVADALKRKGWLFACHSYTHNQYFNNGTITMERIAYDTNKWKRYIEPVTGTTNIYISPFGVYYGATDPRFRYLVESGFNIYCPVGNSRRVYFNGDNIVMPRFNLDGYRLSRGKDELAKYYFDPDSIIDPVRPPPKP
ncbi:MAG: hypothetical protein FWE10_07170 [Rikenellaceae bacterium]|nr:hypothetical protein [Rikenellaceae bacterium]MCL2692360.1 hypothetical protein [Rikenellaceae bacterium]